MSRSVATSGTKADQGSTRRLAAIIPAEDVSGPGRQLAALALQLRQHSWQSRVFVLWRTGHARPPYADYLERLGVDFELIADGGPFDVGLVARLADRLGTWQPAVVQTHGYKATAAAAVLRSRASWRWVGCYHGATAESRRAALYHRLDRRMLTRADAVIVMSDAQAALFPKRGRVQIVHNAVIPLERSEEGARAAVLAACADLPAPRIAFVGRLSHEKGGDVLIDALAQLRSRGFGGGLAIAGVGPEEGRWKALVDARGLNDIVHFLGSVAPVDALYDAVDVVVLPSRSEGLPNVLLEALYAGKPVVATRVGAVPAVVTSASVGTIVRPDDAAALAQAIEGSIALSQDPAAATARAEVVRSFSVERRAARHLAVYAQVLTKPGGAVA